jgi:hypothetical protein
MRRGVPFIAPRQLGAVGGQLGRPNLPSVGWCTGQSGAPPDSHCSRLVRDLLPYLAPPTQSGVPNRPLLRATRRPRIAQSTVGAGDRCLIGQSGAPPDSPVNYSHVVFSVSREWQVHRRGLTGQSGAPPGSPVNYSRTTPLTPGSGLITVDQPGAPDAFQCTTGQSGVPVSSRCWLLTANSSSIQIFSSWLCF